MHYTQIVQPIIKLSEIKPEEFDCSGLPLAKLSNMQEWTMNTLKPVDKDIGTQRGVMGDADWMRMMKGYFEGYMETEFTKIGEAVKSNSKDYALLFRLAHS